MNIIQLVGSEICVLHCCKEYIQFQKYEKYLMFTQSPPFQPQYIPEQDNIVSKRVEIIPINAPNIILFFLN